MDENIIRTKNWNVWQAMIKYPEKAQNKMNNVIDILCGLFENFFFILAVLNYQVGY